MKYLNLNNKAKGKKMRITIVANKYLPVGSKEPFSLLYYQWEGSNVFEIINRSQRLNIHLLYKVFVLANKNERTKESKWYKGHVNTNFGKQERKKKAN